MKESVALFTIFVVILCRYYYTLSPNIAGGDSGELVSEGCILGTPHPPGYPLFMLMTNALTKVHESYDQFNVAYLVNLTSATFTALAAVFIALIVKQFTNSHIPSMIFAAGLFAFSPLIWQYAVTAEVFPMNTFFAALLLYITVKFAVSRQTYLVLVGAFVCGLALCNQHTIILFEVPLILYITFLIRRLIIHKPIYILYLGLSFFLGFSGYLALPVVALFYPNGGSWGDVLSIDGWLNHFLRKDYGTFQLFSGNRADTQVEGFTERTWAYVEDLQNTQGLYVIPVLMIIAIIGTIMEFTAVTGSGTSKKSTAVASGVAQSTPNKKKSKSASVTADTSSKSPVSSTSVTVQSTAASVEVNGSEWILSSEVSATLPFLMPTMLMFYFSVFHSLSNLPLSDRLLYGVHQRFWMQPSLISFIYGGVGFYYVSVGIDSLVFPQTSSENKESTSEITGDKASKRKVSIPMTILGFMIAVGAVWLQHNTWLFASDQSKGDYFARYARALLEPLPVNSLLLINYDMQWTAVRYAQNCEGIRPDVTTINLSMMSYDWFESKQSYFQSRNVTFPGSRYGQRGGIGVVKERTPIHDAVFGKSRNTSVDHIHAAAAGVNIGVGNRTVSYFTMADFVQANIHSHRVYIGGKISYPDDRLQREYTQVPLGLVTEFISNKLPAAGKSKRAGKAKVPTASEYAQQVLVSLKRVVTLLPALPPSDQYTAETWEWTIGRDFKDRLNDVAAYMLEAAIAAETAPVQGQDQPSKSSPLSLVAAVYLLETAVIYEKTQPLMSSEHVNSTDRPLFSLASTAIDQERRHVPTSLLKNIGLAYLHIIKSRSITVGDFEFFVQGGFDVFTLIHKHSIQWPGNDDVSQDVKVWSVGKFMEYWGEFLARPEAREDAQYETIKSIYATASGAGSKSKPAPQSTATATGGK